MSLISLQQKLFSEIYILLKNKVCQHETDCEAAACQRRGRVCGCSQAEDLTSSGCGKGSDRNRGSSRDWGSHHYDDTIGLPVRKGNGIQQYVRINLL